MRDIEQDRKRLSALVICWHDLRMVEEMCRDYMAEVERLRAEVERLKQALEDEIEQHGFS